MVELVGARQSEHLRDLTPEAEALVAEGVDKMVREFSQPWILQLLVNLLEHCLVWEGVEELGEVEEEDVPVRAVLPEVSLRVALQSVDGEVVALALHAGAVVMDEGASHQRDETLVA